MSSLEESVLKNLETFVVFARKRLRDAHLAEDVVQESLVKALAAERKPTGDEATTAWFYRILTAPHATAPAVANLSPPLSPARGNPRAGFCI